MLTKRIIPCLDIKNVRTVKGINFDHMRDAGDPVELAIEYCAQGADELVFLDITASLEQRKTLVDLVKRIARNINIPFTVGGGINSLNSVSELLNAGADKISINTSAFQNPELIRQIAGQFGSQCCVVAIDTKKELNEWYVYIKGGGEKTPATALNWAIQAESLGAGEILLTSMNADGTKTGFSNDITKILSSQLNIPVIASGGAGSLEHFKNVFTEGCADAALAASVFHFKEIEIPVLKNYLRSNKIETRL